MSTNLSTAPINPPMDTLNIIKDILDKQLQMPKGRVFAYNSEIDLPKDGDLFIVLYNAENEVFANNNQIKNSENGLIENQSLNQAETIIVSLCSKGRKATQYAPYALMAMRSTYAEQLMEKYHCHISSTTNIRDMSFLEATAMLTRKDFEIKIFRAYDTINDIDYYDKFPNTSEFKPYVIFQE